MYSLYLVTSGKPNLEKIVDDAIRGGVTVVQLREKELESLDFYNLGLKIKTVCGKYKIPLLINDRLDIAQAIDADGIHIGQTDLPCKVARQILGKDKIIGVSATTLQEAIQAEIDGADYVGVGAMYIQNTKKDAKYTTFDVLKQICEQVKIPKVVIGGINKNTIPNFKNFNIDGFAVVSAIMDAENIEKATRELKELL
ncbi:MAG: thiamine phosphate synthase [Rickettsiales bacterium]|jgi:thiamine-phosphate pyrophosphorylase|nr:thiamine phosphate synthase [Rickettsiales bacterium]